MKKILETLNRKWAEYLLEMIVIIVGILVAFMLDSSKESISNDRTEQEILKGLKTELNLNKEGLRITIEQHQESYEYNLKLLTYFNVKNRPANSQSLDTAIVRMFSHWTFNPRLGYLKSIISSGKLAYIKDSQLVALLSEFEDATIDTNEGTEEGYKTWLNQLSLRVWQHVPYNSQFRVVDAMYMEGVPISQFQASYDDFFNDPMLESMLSRMSAIQSNALDEENNLLVTIETMIDLINKNLQ